MPCCLPARSWTGRTTWACPPCTQRAARATSRSPVPCSRGGRTPTCSPWTARRLWTRPRWTCAQQWGGSCFGTGLSGRSSGPGRGVRGRRGRHREVRRRRQRQLKWAGPGTAAYLATRLPRAQGVIMVMGGLPGRPPRLAAAAAALLLAPAPPHACALVPAAAGAHQRPLQAAPCSRSAACAAAAGPSTTARTGARGGTGAGARVRGASRRGCTRRHWAGARVRGASRRACP